MTDYQNISFCEPVGDPADESVGKKGDNEDDNVERDVNIQVLVGQVLQFDAT